MGRPGRLPEHDYGSAGCYFITFCTKNRRTCLSAVVGRDDPGAPHVRLSRYGEIVRKQIESIPSAYGNVGIDKYVIMPNHVHLIVRITARGKGAPGSSRPTQTIPRVVAALKRFSNQNAGVDLWQSTYHDHVIRNEADYLRIWDYIDANPAKWREDRYYMESGG